MDRNLTSNDQSISCANTGKALLGTGGSTKGHYPTSHMTDFDICPSSVHSQPWDGGSTSLVFQCEIARRFVTFPSPAAAYPSPTTAGNVKILNTRLSTPPATRGAPRMRQRLKPSNTARDSLRRKDAGWPPPSPSPRRPTNGGRVHPARPGVGRMLGRCVENGTAPTPDCAASRPGRHGCSRPPDRPHADAPRGWPRRCAGSR